MLVPAKIFHPISYILEEDSTENESYKRYFRKLSIDGVVVDYKEVKRLSICMSKMLLISA